MAGESCIEDEDYGEEAKRSEACVEERSGCVDQRSGCVDGPPRGVCGRVAEEEEEDESLTTFDTMRDVMIISDPVAPVWSINDFEIARKLGHGQFGSVFLARERRTKYLVALKAISKAKLLGTNNEHLLRREIEIHSHLIHPNILGFYGWFTTRKHICLIIEVAYGELMDQIISGGLPEKQVSTYMLQMISAIRSCHKLNVIHRDLKPENILVTLDNNLKLADFGWAAHIANDAAANHTPTPGGGGQPPTVGGGFGGGAPPPPRNNNGDYLRNRRKTYCGTLDYLSPEILRKEWYGREVDLWCLGVLCFELLTGGPPFPSIRVEGASEDEARAKQQKDIQLCAIEQRLLHYSSLSPEVKDFLRRSLNKDPNLRLTTEQMIRHPFITKFNDTTKELAIDRIFDSRDLSTTVAAKHQTPNMRGVWEQSRIFLSSQRSEISTPALCK